MLQAAASQRRQPLFGTSAMAFFWFILIGLIAGWLAGNFTKGSGFGLPGNVIVGVIGALLGGFLFRIVGHCCRRPAGPAGDRHYRRGGSALSAATGQEILGRMLCRKPFRSR
jgi:uncharacterized membrane protein YeaQ/YmgE (transglycosylase-associated protein family)